MTGFADEPAHVSELRAQLRRFVEREAPPEKRRAWDRAQTFPRDLFQKLADMGLCGLTIEERYGGAGIDIVAAIAAIEELARAGAFLCGPFIHCAFYGGMNIGENGSPGQKAALLPKLARGEILFAYGLSEPDVGGDLASVRTRVRREGEEIVISGAKRWCTAADQADYIYCLCNSDPEGARTRDLTFVLVPPGTTGVTIQRLTHVNLRYAHSCDVYLDEVRLPAGMIVGGEAGWGRGWQMLAGRALDAERLEITAATFGIAQAAVEEAFAYAGQRRQFGKPISGHQAVRHALVDARTRLEACRHMLYHAAWLASENRPCAVESAMAKLFVGEAAAEIALICQRVMGAYALSPDAEMERHVRDLLGMAIVGGSSNMQRNNIANLLRLPG